MMRTAHITVCLTGTLLATTLAPIASGNEVANPYLAIIERNPFGLKPPPPPDTNAPTQPPAPVAKVTLTGITSMFGPDSKRALLEIEEQDPGSKSKSTRKPILREGEKDGSVEVLSINIEKNIVRIRTGQTETDLTFEKPNPSTAPGAVPPPLGALAVAANAQGNTGPILVTRESSKDLASAGGVHLMGGAQPTAAGPVTPAAYGGAGPSSAYGRSGSVSMPMGGTGLQIPSRPLRTQPQPIEQPDPRLNVKTPEEAFIIMERMREAGKGNPRAVPLPPTPLTPFLQEEP